MVANGDAPAPCDRVCGASKGPLGCILLDAPDVMERAAGLTCCPMTLGLLGIRREGLKVMTGQT